jgi:mannan endo-1,4-beta-mannosidase
VTRPTRGPSPAPAGSRRDRRSWVTLRTSAAVVLLAALVALGVVFGYRLAGRTPRLAQAPRTRAPTYSVPAGGKVPAPPRGEVYWGVFAPSLPFGRTALATLQHRVGRRPAIAMWYQGWSRDPDFPAAAAARLARLGVVPMITWEPWQPPRVPGTLFVHQPRYRLARIAAGAFDRYVARYAREVKRYGGPIMLRPFHEMDGNWYPWGGTVNGNTPRDFVAAWRHVHDVFARLGVDNVTWVWSVNATSVPARADNTPQAYWPGGRYVDWIGISGFNWGLSRSFGSWSSFDHIYGSRVDLLRRYHRPIAVTEIAAAEVGGDKAAWIAETFARLRAYPSVRAVVWYDKRASRLEDWRIQSSPEAQAAFARAVATARVRSAPAALRAATGGS